MVAGRPNNDPTFGQLDALMGDVATELWEENMAAVEIFGDMITQWNSGPSGVIGLRYESLPVVMRLRDIPPARRAEVFAGVQVMESAALEHLRG